MCGDVLHFVVGQPVKLTDTCENFTLEPCVHGRANSARRELAMERGNVNPLTHVTVLPGTSKPGPRPRKHDEKPKRERSPNGQSKWGFHEMGVGDSRTWTGDAKYAQSIRTAAHLWNSSRSTQFTVSRVGELITVKREA